MAYQPLHSAAALLGGWDGARPPDSPVVSQRPAAGVLPRGPAAGPWPEWARPQLGAAVNLAATAADRMSVAGLLYRNWFNPETGDASGVPGGTPLAGLYRESHAGSGTRVRRGDLSVVARQDVLRAGGWWRTWGEYWTPGGRRASVRLLLTPRADALGEFVATVTGRLLPTRIPWSLACATDPWRIARSGCAVLDLPGLESIPGGLLADLGPLLRPVTPPLCLPVAPGVGAAQYPDNGMTFGEHRCHLVALGLRHRRRARDPLSSISAVFSAYGIDPAAPYRNT
ncbi:MAG: hypothetical protein QOI15_1685 [Pseudonocardiales bacterium]|nr:hypothetical protein [Pseudonocardiales bacterium]